MEAADDICYEIMDIEDAHKLKLLSNNEAKNLLLSFFTEEQQEMKRQHMDAVDDENEQIAYLRSSVIGVLVEECSNAFLRNEEAIMEGSFQGALIDDMSELVGNAYRKCQEISLKKIYKSNVVMDIEIAGYNIIHTLIDKVVNAVFNPDKAYSRQLINRIPEQYETENEDPYRKIMAVLDYLSGMTDIYALDLYRKINGMSLPSL